MARDHWRRRHTSTLRGDAVPATPTECSVSRKAGFMLQILPCWSTVNIGKLMLSMFIVSPTCHGMHRVLAGCSESVRWDCSVVSLAAATHRGHGGLSASAEANGGCRSADEMIELHVFKDFIAGPKRDLVQSSTEPSVPKSACAKLAAGSPLCGVTRGEEGLLCSAKSAEKTLFVNSPRPNNSHPHQYLEESWGSG